MKRALVITYYWPPGSGPGVQRWLKFCKYMPEFGWEPIVITVKNGSYPYTDPSLEKDIPANITVIRTRTIEPFSLYNLLRGRKGKTVEVGMGSIRGKKNLLTSISKFIRGNYFIPDARVGWNRFSLKAARKLISEQAIDAIITSGPPHSTHLVGMQLKKEFGLPWFADLRDPWTNVFYYSDFDRTQRSIRKDQELEDLVANGATCIITTTFGLEDEFRSRAKKIATIPNGYDDEDFQGINNPDGNADKFTLSYIGNLKPNQNPAALWKALEELLDNPEFKKQFELRLTGNVHSSILEELNRHNLTENTRISDFVKHHEAISQMAVSHLLLLPVPNSPGNSVILTGKIFEYLASRRPILSIGPVHGNAAQVIDECGKDKMIDYQDKEAIKKQIIQYFELFKNDRKPVTNGNSQFQNFGRKGLTRKLAHLLDQCIGP
ncbi:MAG: glycosyltransferase family 4 protein [Flavobacteriales bacterium]